MNRHGESLPVMPGEFWRRAIRFAYVLPVSAFICWLGEEAFFHQPAGSRNNSLCFVSLSVKLVLFFLTQQ